MDRKQLNMQKPWEQKLLVIAVIQKQVYTSLSKEEMLEMLGKIADFKIVDETGFPKEGEFVTGNIGASGSCIVPQDLEENVIWLHQFLFDDEDYQVTDGVRERSEMVESRTAKYLNKD